MTGQRGTYGTVRPAGTPRPPASRGFTLIETIVVLVILGLALSIVASFLPRRNTTLELSAATDRVSGALRMARSRAMTESRPVPFATAPDRHGFSLDNVPVFLGATVTVIMDGRGIVFEPDGSNSGGTIQVVVDGRQRVIHINWLTGRVAVESAS